MASSPPEADAAHRLARRVLDAGLDSRHAAVLVEGDRFGLPDGDRSVPDPGSGRSTPRAGPGDTLRIDLRAGDVSDALVAVRALALVGVERLLILADGEPLSGRARAASIGIVADHVNLRAENPLTGANDDDFGPRFPDMTGAYDPGLRSALAAGIGSAGIAWSDVVAGSCDRDAGDAGAVWTDLGIDVLTGGIAPPAIVARHAGIRVAALIALSPLATESVTAAVRSFAEAD